MGSKKRWASNIKTSSSDNRSPLHLRNDKWSAQACTRPLLDATHLTSGLTVVT